VVRWTGIVSDQLLGPIGSLLRKATYPILQAGRGGCSL